jgi:hypothetical protein
MKIVIEFDPGELARGAVAATAPTASVTHAEQPATVLPPADGAAAPAATGHAIDAGPALGAARAGVDHASQDAYGPAEVAAAAAAIGAISAGPAPNIG